MLIWAKEKHRRYKKDFGDKYPRDRKAMIPFIVWNILLIMLKYFSQNICSFSTNITKNIRVHQTFELIKRFNQEEVKNYSDLV